jgi:hypothetical protein
MCTLCWPKSTTEEYLRGFDRCRANVRQISELHEMDRRLAESNAPGRERVVLRVVAVIQISARDMICGATG